MFYRFQSFSLLMQSCAKGHNTPLQVVLLNAQVKVFMGVVSNLYVLLHPKKCIKSVCISLEHTAQSSGRIYYFFFMELYLLEGEACWLYKLGSSTDSSKGNISWFSLLLKSWSWRLCKLLQARHHLKYQTNTWIQLLPSDTFKRFP